MKKLILSLAVGAVTIATLTGCVEPTEIQKQQDAKIENAMRVFEQTKVPSINKSLERENIRQRILVSNDPSTVQWIYALSSGRVLGRFPVKGKVTSGSKRLTSNENYVPNEGYVEAPDEMGTYGSSSEYVFWFDPAGRIHQHRGDYFVSPVPYKIDKGYGTIEMEIDQNEEKNIKSYKEQIGKVESTIQKQKDLEQEALEKAMAKAKAEEDGGKTQ